MLVLWSALIFAANAGDCDAAKSPAQKPLIDEMTAASPAGVAAVYVKMVACGADFAKSQAPAAFQRILPGTDADAAAAGAIGVGAGDTVRTWLAGLESDQRSEAIGALGAQCKDNAPVASFFVESANTLGEDFYKQRYFRGLAECRTPEVQTLLAAAVKDQAAPKPGVERSQFNALLEVYARNLGAAAIPTLVDLGHAQKDDETSMYIVNAFADAANVGAQAGIDAKAAAQAVSALQTLGPDLPAKAIEQGRTTLTALGDDKAADGFVAYRWPDRKVDGNYRYAAVAVDLVTCKNGKKQAYFHSANASEPGHQWPDELQALIGEKLDAEWHLQDAATTCHGTADVKVAFPTEPFADDAARQAWLDDQKKAFTATSAGFDKVASVAHPALDL